MGPLAEGERGAENGAPIIPAPGAGLIRNQPVMHHQQPPGVPRTVQKATIPLEGGIALDLVGNGDLGADLIMPQTKQPEMNPVPQGNLGNLPPADHVQPGVALATRAP